jgi:LLGL2
LNGLCELVLRVIKLAFMAISVMEVLKLCYLSCLCVADEPNSLLVLAEEELVVIDLSTRDWPVFNNPYLCSLHNSAITCVSYANNVPENLWSKISDVGRLQSAGFSQRVSRKVVLYALFSFFFEVSLFN